MVVTSKAAVPYASTEPEAGVITGGSARIVTDANASSSHAVLFAKATGASPTAMKMISLGKPAYASAGTASYGNDTSYDTYWSPGSSGWLAYDLSSEPAANRQSIVLAWYTNPDDGHSVVGYAGACPTWSGRPYIANYTVEVNSAAGGGSAPTSGWQTVVTVTDNTSLSGQHRINFAGYNWVRINGNGPNGININAEVADASNGVTDGWLFLGDSQTVGYAGHFVQTDPTGTVRRSFTELISAGTSAVYRPIQENAAMSCTKSYDALEWIDGFLAAYPGKYVTLNFGSNDSWDGSGDPAFYKTTMQALINKVQASGKVAVIPLLFWPNNGGSWQTQVETFNTKIVELYNENPTVVRGPDLYTLTKDRTELYRATGDVHFNDSGAALARKAWADAMLTNVYNK